MGDLPTQEIILKKRTPKTVAPSRKVTAQLITKEENYSFLKRQNQEFNLNKSFNFKKNSIANGQTVSEYSTENRNMNSSLNKVFP